MMCTIQPQTVDNLRMAVILRVRLLVFRFLFVSFLRFRIIASIKRRFRRLLLIRLFFWFSLFRVLGFDVGRNCRGFSFVQPMPVVSFRFLASYFGSWISTVRICFWLLRVACLFLPFLFAYRLIAETSREVRFACHRCCQTFLSISFRMLNDFLFDELRRSHPLKF
ncbi:hypothetical protein TRFO_06146 [Tritrichomonas foetus]|uniref:Uncharacterized protein n=1 Tax=Tritrichomonas foetus TaxID=1144522 RepID=A0A1J4K0G4_9EUKA|nr:hypothetical protein TRFO_06146 [Tritrichomonas foetus]|eukprot:OHT04723.1 hypothetical protein TRFO_06146 [Tritrichomonas foetus]